MANKLTNIQHKALLSLPLLLLITLIVLTKSVVFQASPSALSLGITLDCLLTVPVLYFLIIRKTDIPNITVVSVFVICTLIASYIIPIEQQSLLKQIKYFAIPLVELGVLAFVFVKAKAIIKAVKATGTSNYDFFEVVSLACTQVLPHRVGKLLATEISVIYYSFFASSYKVLQDNEYTYYKKSGIKMVVGTFIGLILAETMVMHLVLQKWNITVAWVLTFLSLYTCLQVIALLRSMNLRLISMDDKEAVLHLKYGFFSETTIPFHQIESLELNKRTLPIDNSVIQFSPLGSLDSHNLIIRLKGEQTLHRLYGIQNKYQNIAVYVDEREKFVAQLNTALKALD